MRVLTWRRLGLVALGGLVMGAAALPFQARGQEGASTAPASVTIRLPRRAPAGAVQLFTGKAEQMRDNWYQRGSTEPAQWTVDSEGVAAPNKHDITSKQEFGDAFVHVEFQTPATGGGNAGVGLQGRYEIQIMNSYGQKPEAHQAGSLYSQKAARVIASKPAGQWETYDIIFRAPRFDDNGQVTEKARATVFQNGILVQNNEEFNGPTGIQYGEFKGEAKTGPLVLQGDHDPVKYRNIWVVPM